MRPEKHLPQRRSFLGRLAMLGSALALAPFVRPRRAKTETSTETPAQKAAYRLTPHIQKYYETAAK